MNSLTGISKPYGESGLNRLTEAIERDSVLIDIHFARLAQWVIFVGRDRFRVHNPKITDFQIRCGSTI